MIHESRRTPHEQVPAGRLPLFIAAPEEEPLNDLAQPLLGLLRREEGGAGRWFVMRPRRHGRSRMVAAFMRLIAILATKRLGTFQGVLRI